MRLEQYATGRWAYRCETCGLVQPWGPGWTWYGSMRELDEGPVPTFCSTACATMWAQTMGKPPVVLLDR